MKGAIFIFGGNFESREKAVETVLRDNLEFKKILGIPDILFIDALEGKSSIGIGQVRDMVKYINQRPYSHINKAVIVYLSHLLTAEAQNALLKTLEETPSYASIILCAPTKKDLLPTVISRCQLINLKNSNAKNEKDLNIELLLQKNYGERMFLIEDLAKEEKSVILDTLNSWVSTLRVLMLNVSNKQKVPTAQKIEFIQEVGRDIESTNINVKLALEYLVLHL